MQNMSFIKLLKKLCQVHAISGNEQGMVKAIAEELENRGAKYEIDRMGNVCAKIRGKDCAPSLMLIAHMDEVGAVVNEIYPNGLISFRTVGCIDKNSIASMRVAVGGIPATISAPPAHMSGKGQDAVKLYIDIGAETAQEVANMGIRIGSPISFDTPFVKLGKNRVCSRAVDDRVGCAMLISLLDEIDYVPAGDILLGFSVREETTMAGAGMLVDRFKPDCVIAIDTVPIRMDLNKSTNLDLGRGPVFQLAEGVMAAYVGSFVHPGIEKALFKAAKLAKTDFQLCAEIDYWTTDGDAISRANCGTPGGYISIPRRNAHSGSEVMDIRDPLGGIKIIKELIRNMDTISIDFI